MVTKSVKKVNFSLTKILELVTKFVLFLLVELETSFKWVFIRNISSKTGRLLVIYGMSYLQKGLCDQIDAL